MAAGDTGRLAGLDPTFLAHFEAMRSAALARHGIRVRVVAGFRTNAEQWALWRLYLAGKGNLAAYPGTSNHEARRPAGTGFAIDMAPNVDVEPRLVPLLAEFGLCLPVKPPRARQWEPWHIEPCWIQPRTSPEYRPRPPLPGTAPPPLLTPEDPVTTHVKLHPDVTKPPAEDGTGGRGFPAGEAVADSGRLIPVLAGSVVAVLAPERTTDLSGDRQGSFAVIDAFANAIG